MPKRLLSKLGIRIRKGEKLEITRDTLVKNPRPKKEVEERDKIEKKKTIKKKAKK